MSSAEIQEIAELKEDLQDALKQIGRLEKELEEAYESCPGPSKPEVEDQTTVEQLKERIDLLVRQEVSLQTTVRNLTEERDKIKEQHKRNYIRALSLLRSIQVNERDITNFLRSGVWQISREWIEETFNTEVGAFLNLGVKGKKS